MEPAAPASVKGLGRLAPRWRRFASIALTWYVVSLIFGFAYGLTRLVWPDSEGAVAWVVAALAAGPLAVAFIWERLTGLKVFGVEVTLAQVTTPVDETLATALSERQYFTGQVAIFELIDRAIANPDTEILAINLRSAPYWWSTRLFLQAALTQERTNIARLVFVEGDDANRYVGMASPGEVRRAIARLPGANLEEVYRAIEKSVQNTPGPPGQSEAQRIVKQWAVYDFTVGAATMKEDVAKVLVSAELLHQWVRLETATVEWSQPLDSALRQALVLEKGSRFVPITQNGRLERVVNADAFARRTTTQILRARLH